MSAAVVAAIAGLILCHLCSRLWLLVHNYLLNLVRRQTNKRVHLQVLLLFAFQVIATGQAFQSATGTSVLTLRQCLGSPSAPACQTAQQPAKTHG